MAKLFFSLGLIISGLILGYAIQILSRNGAISLPQSISEIRKMLQKISLLFIMPVSFMAAVWIVPFDNVRVILVPVVGVCALVAGGIFGLAASAALRKSASQKAVLFCCGSFTNIGAIGALVCYVFLGEAGFALVALYKMFEEIVYYTIGFPLARFYSGAVEQHQSLARRLKGVLTDPFVATILTAFFIGLFLNLMNVPRPTFLKSITALFIPVGTFMLIVSIGLGMRFSSVRSHLRECLTVSLIKVTAVPAVACSLAYFLGLHLIDNGLPFRVILILSSMPVAFNALVAASIYDLDLDLANSCWLISTVSLVIVMPWLYFLLSSGWLP